MENVWPLRAPLRSFYVEGPQGVSRSCKVVIASAICISIAICIVLNMLHFNCEAGQYVLLNFAQKCTTRTAQMRLLARQYHNRMDILAADIREAYLNHHNK